MGDNKPLAPYGGTTLIEATLARLRPQADDIRINARPDLADALAILGLPLLIDDAEFADLGPLSGVRTALKAAKDAGHDHVVTAPCDMPNLPTDMVAQLTAADGDIVHFSGACDYPLCARWKTTLLLSLEAALVAARPHGGLRVMRYIAGQAATRLPADDDAFININTLP